MKNYLLILCFLLSGTAYGQADSSGNYAYVKPLFDFNPRQPLFSFSAEQLQNTSRYLRYWALTGYREGVMPTIGPFGTTFLGVNDSISGTRRLYMHNLSVVEMVTHYTGNNDRILLDVGNPSKYRYLPEYGSKELWLRENGRCFEIMLPKGTIEGMNTIDPFLTNALGITVAKQRRQVKALILFQLGKDELFKSKRKGVSSNNGKGKFNQSIFLDLGKLLTGDMIPFVDETRYVGLVDLNLQIRNWKNIKAVNKELGRYGLRVKEEMRDLDMLVITEINEK
jgi:hypothetical protein